MASRTIHLGATAEVISLCGRNDEHIRLIEERMGVEISPRGTELTISGEDGPVEITADLIERLLAVVRSGGRLRTTEVKYAIRDAVSGGRTDMEAVLGERVEVWSKRRFVTAKTEGQRAYVHAIRTHDISFGIGPAGTGKTYLAMALAVSALKSKAVSRIILVRPAVEAGEKLGFLPGDLDAKVAPYLRPLFDALYDMMEADRIQRFLEQGVIEVVPLAYMRGRTLNDAFVILDEAQNSTSDQMKMFLTRLGFDSKAVVTGDDSQIDLPRGTVSGLLEVGVILAGIPGIAFVRFSRNDVVRHELVQEIIAAYERAKGGAHGQEAGQEETQG